MRYRIWDNKEKRYLANGFVVGMNGLVYHIHPSVYITAFERKNYIIELSTGLFDKNGVEIYEGDVLEVRDDEGRIDYIDCGKGEVQWLDEFAFFYIAGNVQNGLGDLKYCRYFEVIGNIHEEKE